jgi:hypothetical protein
MVRFVVDAVVEYKVVAERAVEEANVAVSVVPLKVRLVEVESAPAPLPKRMVPEVMFAQPVPPFAVARTPVTSVVRETVLQVATPAPLRERTN